MSTIVDKRELAVVSLDLLPYLEAQAKERQATSTGGSNPQLVEIVPQAEQGKAREQAEPSAISGSTGEGTAGDQRTWLIWGKTACGNNAACGITRRGARTCGSVAERSAIFRSAGEGKTR